MKRILNSPDRLLRVFLLCAGLVMVSCEEDAPIGGENEEIQTPPTLSLDKVTATTAAFTGHLDVSVPDLSSGKITLYYSDADTFNINAAQSISVESFDNQQNFSATITGLKYGRKYTCCAAADIKSEKVCSDVLNFTTETVAFAESAVSSGCFETSISGRVTGLSEEDKGAIKVGIIYSTDSGKVETGEGSKVELSEISSDGEFSVLLSDLAIDTEYYYSGYVCQGSDYAYETPAQFKTLHPYDISSDLDVASAVDLSSSASANCYIVSEPGLYKFKVVKGNSTSSVGNVASAAILWETFGTSIVPERFDLIGAFCYKDGYIAFKTPESFKEGNAVIAAKDASGTILWSWHIWLTDQPQNHIYNNNAGTMMDRNLGATSATPGEVGTLGLLYQWGRKDPFLNSSSISDNIDAMSTITWPIAVVSDSANGTIDYATAHPTTFIACNSDNRDWYYTGDSSTDNTRWTTSDYEKSIYDPCPPGWRVPPGREYGVWYKAGFNDTTPDNTNKGISFSISSPSQTWYPFAGCRASEYVTGVPEYLILVGRYGHYWSASPLTYNVFCLDLDYFGRVDSTSGENRYIGMSVRCIQE